MISSSNKRIARNTLMLYVRLLLSMVVSLYTSRVVLHVLGVDDFGIYGVVGGVVTLFAFLNASMSGATSRFITFALGKEDQKELSETFSTAIIIHIGIALLILLLAETIGLWFLNNELEIPTGRMNAARIVYQFSIIGMAVQVTQVPYNASIISYEKMDIYAYVELLNVGLKLGIVFLLEVGSFDKLIFYAFLVLCVNVIIALTYRVYCLRHFDSCRFKFVIDKTKLIPMLSFSGWDLYGNMCYSVRQQGINILINMFFGVVLNAASSVATSIQGIISNLSANIIQAFRPQIIKKYAQGEYLEMQKLMANALKYTLLLFMLISVPAFMGMEIIMKLWLGSVPEYAPNFCRAMLGISLFNLINSILCIAIQSTGNIKRVSFISGSIYLSAIPIIYLIFKYLVDDAIYAYIVSLTVIIAVVIVNFRIVKMQIPSLSIKKILRSSLVAIAYSALALTPIIIINHLHLSSIVYLLSICGSYGLTLLSLTMIFDKPTRDIVMKKLKLK